jgi:drug/metabolite transporter (DMT)-like permease
MILAVAFAFVRPHLTGSQVAAALAGGVVGALALNLIYAALRAGAMSLVAPLVACGTAIVPSVASSVAGQPPDALQILGTVFALSGVLRITWSPQGGDHESLTTRALMLAGGASLAGGVCFSILLLAAKGPGEVAVGIAAVERLSALATCLLFLPIVGGGLRLPSDVVPRIAAAGAFEACGGLLYLLSSTLGSTAVAGVVTSLYAIVTVFLARLVLRERIGSGQAFGVLAAVIGVALLSVG